jgi:excinuclease ABC subunit A
LPSVYAPCPTCKGARYNAKTLEIKIRDKSIADVLAMTVDAAFEFFADDVSLQRSLGVIREVGLGYIRLGAIGNRAVRRRSPTHQACD